MVRNCFLGLLALGLVSGCATSPPKTNASPPSSSLKSNFGPDANREYAVKILAALDKFAEVTEEAQRLDESTIRNYQKSLKPSKAMLDKMSQGVTASMDVLKTMREIPAPSKYDTFHKQVIKSTERKVDNYAGLLLAMETDDKAEIKRVLDALDREGKESKREMDKILDGLTAEQYLGVK